MRGFWLKLALLLGLIVGGGLAASAAPVAAASFDSLRNEAVGYLNGLRKAAPPDPKGDARKLAMKKAEQDGDAAAKAGDPAKAIQFYEQALALGGPPFSAALKMADAWMARTPPSPERALQAAYIAVLNAANTGAAGAALWRLADLYEKLDKPRLARDALLAIARKVKDDPQGDQALLLTQRERLPARLLEVRRRLGLSVLDLNVEAAGERPRICLDFDESLNADGKTRFEDFVALSPAPAEMAADADGARLCLTGPQHGMVYRLTVRQGLPGYDGVVLKAGFSASVVAPDRPPTLAFRGQGRILPRVGAEGVPFTAVNVDQVAVKIYRINDRAVTPYLRDEGLNDETGPWQAEQLADRHGELAWEGSMAVPLVPNKESVAAIPFAQAVPKPQPGLYAVTIDAKGVDQSAKPWGMATQWLQVTDIGLTAVSGADGLTVFVRSLSTALPTAKAALALVARNNDELARVETDGDGRAVFPPGLLKPEGGRQPFAVMAYLPGDFVSLNLTQPAFDLSDRGVSGRTQPGPLDAYLYADRGIYRQGETVNLTALLRDDRTAGLDDFPLTIKIFRPSGAEYLAKTLTTAHGGAATLAVPLSATAPLGGWRVAAFADPNRPPIGTARFQVDDFVPERLAVELEPSAPWLGEGDGPFALTVRGRFLYGAPAAGLGGTAEMRVETDPTPFPAFADYAFGLPGEQAPGEAQALPFDAADVQGVTTLNVDLGQLPDVTTPLRAKFAVAMLEPGGRPAKATAVYPIRRHAVALGVKLADGGARLKEGAAARFAVVALGRDGAAVARPGLRWRLIRERADFQWFFEEGRYRYRAVRHDEAAGEGQVDVAAAAPAMIAVGAPLAGRYRLEVSDAEQGTASAKRFVVGWEPPDEPSDTPDALDVVADKPAYRSGETARLRITPPFAGQLLLTIATDRLHVVKTMAIPAEGLTVEAPVDAAAWGPGAYVTATVYRPPQAGKERQPVRALGLSWIAVDPGERSLKVELSTPAVVRPRGARTITLKAAGEDGKPPSEPVHVTLAAVDEGILRLTRFASPDPARHFFGKRALGVDIRDDYGRLIAPFDGAPGVLRQGGDASGAGLPALPFQLVSLFQGPVKLAADGTAQLTVDLPDFNGELRLMAVAFSGKRLGAASLPLTVRDPLTAEAYLPRFMAPGDRAAAALSLHNVEAPNGRFTGSLTAVGGLDVAGEASTFDVTLKPGQRISLSAPLIAAAAAEGVAQVVLKVAGPGGFAVERRYSLTVRSPRPVERTRVVRKLEPGQETLLSAADLAAYRPDTAMLSAAFGATPPFDVAGILQALYRYPYGCVEQTVSTALPLLALERLEQATGVAKPDRDAAARVQKAISTLLDRQRSDGSFSRWSASEAETQNWLTAYVGEFLVRAKQSGRFVPDTALRELLGWLERHAVDGGTDDAALASRAYALHVLTLAGAATVSPARYFHDAFIDRLPTPLAKAQVAAALARFGDRMRAEHAFGQAVAKLTRKYWAEDYGSTVRDAAAIVRLADEVGMLAPYLEKLLARLPANDTAAKRTATQEQAWLVLAADALAAAPAAKDGEAGLRLTVSGAAARGRNPVTVAPDAAQLAAGVRVVNAGTVAVWQSVSVGGAPLAPPAAQQEGFVLKRSLFDRQGRAVDAAAMAQNTVFVVVLEGKSTTGVEHQAMLTQPLPAGWEIDRALTNEDRGEETPMPWLAELTETVSAQARDDRFNAALDLSPDNPEFRVAFTVRAVTPGDYELPGASIEDMYQPRFAARLGWARTLVEAAR